MAFLIITAIILIKYKPRYKVSINDKELGYIDSPKDLDKYVDEIINAKQSENIAFVNLEKMPELKLELVDRAIDKKENIIKEEINKQLDIEYTSYAITVNGKNTTYLATKQEAHDVVDNLKEEYSSTYTDKLGILQVYSDNYNEISSVNNKEAKTIISKEITSVKKSGNKVKIAKNTKNTNINGVKFSVKPVSGIITSRYGRRSSPGGIGSTNHKGLDIAAKSGAPIYSSASGIVKFAGYKGSLGNLVIIDNGNEIQTYYGHCSKVYVSKGAKVKAGDKIAAIGKTGSATGYHLHFEIHVNGKAVNPQKYIY